MFLKDFKPEQWDKDIMQVEPLQPCNFLAQVIVVNSSKIMLLSETHGFLSSFF